MPDVEVKLDIKAEYQQALNAISEMGKALENVQNKAKVVIDKTNSATANGESGNGDMSMKDIADMKKATQELAGHLAQVAVASTKAKEALQAIAGIEPYNEEGLSLLNKASDGYARLAEMAKNAAAAAESFRRAGTAGLTTEEMIRQTQLAEKHLDTLRKQSVALERSVAAQREQLNTLREAAVELQKQTRQKEENNKQEQLNIALLDKQKKAEEENNYRMELAGKTRLQLVEIIKELNAKLKDSAMAENAEAWDKYNRQLTLANQALRKLNMSARVANIALMQQAQAAQRIGQNIEALTKGFSGLGDALENGELNLTSLGSAFVSLMRDFKAGLGPIGWVMLALQGLQVAFNANAKKTKENKEAIQAYAEWQERLAGLQEKNKEELEKYNGELANAQAIDTLVKKHQDLNAELEKEIANIDKATQLELHRLRLSQDSDAHALAMKKDELGRQLMLGQISKSEYDETLASWQKDFDLNKLKNESSVAAAKLEGAREKERIARDAYATRTEDFDYWNKQKGNFLWNEDRVRLYERQLAEANDTLKENTDKLNKLREEGASETAINNAKTAMRDALAERVKLEREAKIVLLEKYGKGHNMTVEEGMLLYAKEVREMTSHLTEATRLKAEAEKDLEAAVSAKTKAEAEAEMSSINQNIEGQRIVERYESGKKTRKATKQAQALKEKEAQKLEDLKLLAYSLTQKQLKDEIDDAKKSAKSKNTIKAEGGKKRLEYLSGVYNARVDRAAKENAKYLGDNKFTSKEAEDVIAKLQEAVYAGEVEKIELYRNILKLGKKVAENKNVTRKINSQIEEIAR